MEIVKNPQWAEHVALLYLCEDSEFVSRANLAMQEHVPEDLLRSFCIDYCNNFEEFQALRKKFTLNYATAAFQDYLFGRAPRLENIYFNPTSGNVAIESAPISAARCLEQNRFAVRLSRNVSNFIGSILLQGVFAPTLVS